MLTYVSVWQAETHSCSQIHSLARAWLERCICNRHYHHDIIRFISWGYVPTNAKTFQIVRCTGLLLNSWTYILTDRKEYILPDQSNKLPWRFYHLLREPIIQGLYYQNVKPYMALQMALKLVISFLFSIDAVDHSHTGFKSEWSRYRWTQLPSLDQQCKLTRVPCDVASALISLSKVMSCVALRNLAPATFCGR